MLTAAERNKYHKKLWDKFNIETNRLLEMPGLIEKAVRLNEEEIQRGIDPMKQRSLAHLLRDSAKPGWEARRWRARLSGFYSKRDELQKLIQQLVKRRTGISCAELLEALKAQAGISIVQDIDDEKIYFTRSDNTTKVAPVTGLKDRLTRAKKKVAAKRRKILVQKPLPRI